MMPSIEEFKGYPVLVLNPDERPTLQFGLAKCKIILSQLDAIRAFVESGGTSVEISTQ